MEKINLISLDPEDQDTTVFMAFISKEKQDIIVKETTELLRKEMNNPSNNSKDGFYLNIAEVIKDTIYKHSDSYTESIGIALLTYTVIKTIHAQNQEKANIDSLRGRVKVVTSFKEVLNR